MLNHLRKFFRSRRDPRSLDPVRPIVMPEARRARELERRRAELDYEPTVAFYKDQVQERNA